jgi:hypothetical protein
MKPKFILLIAAAMLLSSCGASKLARDQRNLISGTWSMNDVSYENNQGLFKAVVFNDADAICFEGSDWFFRDNNSTGRYTIKGGSLCSGGDRFIRWSVIDSPENYNSMLQFKYIDENRKDISGGVGYRLTIATLTPSEMILKSNVTVDGKPVTVVYKFTKK